MNESYHELIAKSPEFQEVLEMVDKFAKADSSVLIMGESGVGKELVAERIHKMSSRKSGPFVAVNCAAIPSGLLESEMFGHVKGAFTDAFKDRNGRFSMADGGTIFLDEIADLPFVLQRKILRVIQEKKLEKVGSNLTINVDARIIAATNKDLEKLVEEKLFREDLYYRLNVLPVFIPPLRQRKEDILPLANFFLKKYADDNKKKSLEGGFSPNAEQALLSYCWPGNVRELQNCIERACVISKKSVLEKEDLFPIYDNKKSKENENKNFWVFNVQQGDLKTALNDFKANFIAKVLNETDWNQTEAAKVLDIQRTYLSKLIKELNIIRN